MRWSLSKPTLVANDLGPLLMAATPWIDVRAPVEFEQGHLPGAVNLPILNNEERALVGLTYKEKGSAAAVELGYRIISGEIKNRRVQAWTDFLKLNPRAILYCFRGGQRSRIAQSWIFEAGIERPLLQGGYKKARNFLLSQIHNFSERHELLILSGPTGSGKTDLLREFMGRYPILELEGLARHRGSAFGPMENPQPTQINFENQLAVEMLKLENHPARSCVLVEDESRLIGRCALPLPFFEKMRASSVVWIEESFEQRVENIFREYILETAIGRGTPAEALGVFEKHKNSVRSITRKLGGLRAQEILGLIEKSILAFGESGSLDENKEWISRLLSYYYDPLYNASLERRQVHIAFKGQRADCAAFLKNTFKFS